MTSDDQTPFVDAPPQTARTGQGWTRWLLITFFGVAMVFLAFKALGVFLIANGSFEPGEVEIGSCVRMNADREGFPVDCRDSDAQYIVTSKVKTTNLCPADASIYFRVSGDVVCVRAILKP